MIKISRLSLFLLLLILSGCSAKHYYQVQGEQVVFYYKSTEAREVFFASSRNNYTFITTRENNHQRWEVTVPGDKSFAYFYVVDGVITRPDCAFTETDDFGSKNCLYIAEM
ncbi:MAG: hypothetical protein V7782_02745 [Psychromonas sp.]